MTTKEESWRQVVGFEGRYEVSDAGRLRSFLPIGRCWHGPRPPLDTPRMLRPVADQTGRLRVQLRKDGATHFREIHRLVAVAFLGAPPDGKPLAAHKDGNVANNSAENLYWASHTENRLDACRHGTAWRKYGDGVRGLVREAVMGGKAKKAVSREMGVSRTFVYEVLKGNPIQPSQRAA